MSTLELTLYALGAVAVCIGAMLALEAPDDLVERALLVVLVLMASAAWPITVTILALCVAWSFVGRLKAGPVTEVAREPRVTKFAPHRSGFRDSAEVEK